MGGTAAVLNASRTSAAIVVAAAVGLATAHMLLAVNTPPPGSGAPALASPVYYLVVGPIAGLLYYFVIAATLEKTALWVATCGLGAYVFASWFAFPVLYQRPAAVVTELAGGAAGRSPRYVAREEWLRALIAAGRYGEPGSSPPMLAVQPSDTGNVVVRNVSESALVVAVAAVAADEAAAGGWRGCGFVGYAGEGAQEWVELGPGKSAVFELEPLCKEIFLDLESHTEIRVGNEGVPVDEGWWTTSALVAPHGRATERASGNSVLPASYDAHAFYGRVGRED